MKNKKTEDGVDVEQIIHNGEIRTNNPPVGLVNPDTDKLNGKTEYAYDPNLDPQLEWTGKRERSEFDVDKVSLHVHERIDPKTIINGVGTDPKEGNLGDFFHSLNIPLRNAVEFYKHDQSWSNRLIAGDSLLVMNSLLEKEGMSGKVQMVFIDPPYGVKYGSNFQPFVGNRTVEDGKDKDLTQEPETIKAFRDTWELGIHSYLTYMRDRLLLARELLTDSGSCFVQISDENVHLIRNLMDEVFGPENFVSQISFRKTGSMATKYIGTIADFLILYAKDKNNLKFRKLFVPKELGSDTQYNKIILKGNEIRGLTSEERKNPHLIPNEANVFRVTTLQSDGRSADVDYRFEFDGKIYEPNVKSHWKTSIEGLGQLAEKGRIIKSGKTIRYLRYFNDFPLTEITNMWSDVYAASDMKYVVETSTKVIQRCMLMCTDPGDIVLDPTCGSGTTAYVAEQWGRRWITCDTSRVAITLAKQRLMTSVFDFYKLSHEDEGISSGFEYKKVPHVTLKSIAKNEETQYETLYDQPKIDKSKKRVSGPFTVEAVPSQGVLSLDKSEYVSSEDDEEDILLDNSVSREGETSKINMWIDELLKTGIRAQNNQKIEFSRLEILSGSSWIHADGETKDGSRVIVSFGPEHAPLESRQVEMALMESESLFPKPKFIIFSAFQFDPEAGKNIDETKGIGVNILKAQINPDMFTDDLKKSRTSDESFWLIGQPDIEIIKKKNKYFVQVNGFDYYNTKTGEIESGNTNKIVMWELDTDYDGRSLYPRQVFFPMTSKNDVWSKLAKNLKSQIDGELFENYRSTISIPFRIGENKQVAVKIIDDRGIESLRILKVI